ncbi:MAG: hypothetical protein IPJ68_03270 [Candidatus Moraniibacteriota bacterium]|nr:MAG: hypothetical protein IPJ68_03270 [Candidatus Moranbacteria bacterium]
MSEYTFTFESKGTTLFFESIVNIYYDPVGTVTISQNGGKRVFTSAKTLETMAERGMALQPDELEAIVRETEQTIATMNAELTTFATKRNFSKQDAGHMEKMLAKFCHSYFVFDPYAWDRVSVAAADDPQAAKKIAIVQQCKNKLRADVDPTFFHADGYLGTLVRKTSECLSMPETMLQYYRIEELRQLFDGVRVSQAEIDARQTFVFEISEDNNRFFSGERAIEFAKQFYAKNGQDEASEISGKVAHDSGRKVRGKVKIIIRDYGDPEKTRRTINEMNKGDVLVSTTTDPYLMDAFKKASAVVTDVGGLLSHAAITARELDLPCIVGTGVATQVLHDGDLVEVDADHGVVRIVQRV